MPQTTCCSTRQSPQIELRAFFPLQEGLLPQDAKAKLDELYGRGYDLLASVTVPLDVQLCGTDALHIQMLEASAISLLHAPCLAIALHARIRMQPCEQVVLTCCPCQVRATNY